MFRNRRDRTVYEIDASCGGVSRDVCSVPAQCPGLVDSRSHRNLLRILTVYHRRSFERSNIFERIEIADRATEIPSTTWTQTECFFSGIRYANGK